MQISYAFSKLFLEAFATSYFKLKVVNFSLGLRAGSFRWIESSARCLLSSFPKALHKYKVFSSLLMIFYLSKSGVILENLYIYIEGKVKQLVLHLKSFQSLIKKGAESL